MPIRLHFDECVHHAVPDALRRRQPIVSFSCQVDLFIRQLAVPVLLAVDALGAFCIHYHLAASRTHRGPEVFIIGNQLLQMFQILEVPVRAIAALSLQVNQNCEVRREVMSCLDA
jgi:hypothetical protein